MSGGLLQTAVAWGFAASGAFMLVLLVGLLVRLVPLFDAPQPLDVWNAPPSAQAQIAAAWVLSSAALTAIGWVLVAAYLPLATDGVRHDVAALWDPAALIPGLVGLLLGMLAHARLLLGFIALETRCGLCAAASHLAGASSAGS